MDDLYGVLQVSPGADPEVIATAHQWLSERYSPENDPSGEAAEKLQQVNAAYEVLGDADRRAAYDSEQGLAAATTESVLLQAQSSSEPEGEPEPKKKSGRTAQVMLGVVAGVTIFVALAVAITAAFTDDEGTEYPANLGDDEYALDQMALREEDMPEGIEFGGSGEQEAEEWALRFDVNDEDELAAKVDQMEAQGWIKNVVAEGGRQSIAALLGVMSVSTMYTNETTATESTDKFACGLPIELSEQIEEFEVPEIADQTVGFHHRREVLDESGQVVVVLMETAICFRTGRIVHVAQETALEGAQNVETSIETAYKLLDRVNAAYENGPQPEEG
jgi:curved DNA-binding protein CbpA